MRKSFILLRKAGEEVENLPDPACFRAALFALSGVFDELGRVDPPLCCPVRGFTELHVIWPEDNDRSVGAGLLSRIEEDVVYGLRVFKATPSDDLSESDIALAKRRWEEKKEEISQRREKLLREARKYQHGDDGFG